MLNTFENSDRFHRRKLERERHIENMELFSKAGDIPELGNNTNDETAVLSMVDALSGFPLAKTTDPEPVPNTRKHFRKLPLFLIGLCSLLVISLLSFLGRMQTKDASSVLVDNKASEEKINRYNKLSSLINDWGLTPRSRLEDPLSHSAMALDWLANEDVLTENVEDLRTRFALASLYFGTQNVTAGLAWNKNNLWLSSFCKLKTYESVALGINGLLLSKYILALNTDQSFSPRYQ